MEQPVSAASSLAPGARCARHAERAATAVCSRCGDYLCGGCARQLADRLYCEPCTARLGEQHSSRSTQSFVVGLLSANLLIFLGPVAIVLGLLELGAIKRGNAPRGGRGLAMVGVTLGFGGCAMGLTALVVLLRYF